MISTTPACSCIFVLSAFLIMTTPCPQCMTTKSLKIKIKIRIRIATAFVMINGITDNWKDCEFILMGLGWCDRSNHPISSRNKIYHDGAMLRKQKCDWFFYCVFLWGKKMTKERWSQTENIDDVFPSRHVGEILIFACTLRILEKKLSEQCWLVTQEKVQLTNVEYMREYMSIGFIYVSPEFWILIQ